MKVLCFQRGLVPKDVTVAKGDPVSKLFEAVNIVDKDAARALLLTGKGRIVLRGDDKIDIDDETCRAFITIPHNKEDLQDRPKPDPHYRLEKSTINRFTEHLKDKPIPAGHTGALIQVKNRSKQELFDAVVPLVIKAATALQIRAGIREPPSAEEQQKQEQEEEAQQDAPYDPMSEVDQSALAMVMEAGFEPQHCVRALFASSMNPEQAVLWLLEHQGDPALDRPITPPPKPVTTRHGRKFQPDAQAFRKLKELGFGDDDVVAALQVTRNNFNQACELLLGGEDMSVLRQQEALPVKNLLRNILKSPAVWDAMFRPEFVQALELLLESHMYEDDADNNACIAQGLRDLTDTLSRFEPEVYERDEQAQFEDSGLDYAVQQGADGRTDVYHRLLERVLGQSPLDASRARVVHDFFDFGEPSGYVFNNDREPENVDQMDGFRAARQFASALVESQDEEEDDEYNDEDEENEEEEEYDEDINDGTTDA
ncbi:hypothetical protein PTSG_01918 [Salpingoeca rosetta]|uniref:UBA domain-containing protein n=1 Tax=Salpingoeca rosetta (strain ATCC 50818 / BSB-021) TaxID=946362 RepID=F2TZC1_SALR5|nr:uncharacterized protein PTSG_01918 [Salpingoeca rosetta]EGD78945.1 hypothetical protein PTSG_01918 [Salpingoeca rosetta]|eukprot:XP_004997901.1 hypothetical protein PTSG_01918 [Salpingoeca rosetta]